jgi:hypothetical protein
MRPSSSHLLKLVKELELGADGVCKLGQRVLLSQQLIAGAVQRARPLAYISVLRQERVKHLQRVIDLLLLLTESRRRHCKSTPCCLHAESCVSHKCRTLQLVPFVPIESQ